MKNTLTREYYIPKGSTKVEVNSDIVAYNYELNGSPCAAVFVGKATKPDLKLPVCQALGREA